MDGARTGQDPVMGVPLRTAVDQQRADDARPRSQAEDPFVSSASVPHRRTEPSRAPFVGRGRELAELLAGLQDAISGRGALFLVAGEPGIGKTALAEHLTGHAAEQGVRVLWGRSWEGGGAAPYWIWVQVIRALAEGLDDETLRSL